jgi:SAM-dependent methyltransferase
VDRLLEATSDVEQTHFWYRGFRRFVRPLLEQATAGLSRPQLLDCGCGTGANLSLLQQYGDAVGFDLTRRGLEFALHHGHRRLAQASVTEVPFRSGWFDVVTSFDVLYCLPDQAEVAAIAEMHRLLKPGGALVVNVAALEMLRGDHSILGGEIRRYTTGRLRSALEQGGFEVIRATYTNASIFPLVAGVRIWQRLRGLSQHPTHGDFFRPPMLVNSALSGALAAEALALRWTNMPIGSSVLCLARKAPAAAATSEAEEQPRAGVGPREHI